MVIFSGKSKHFGKRSVSMFKHERPPGREKSCYPTGVHFQSSRVTPAASTHGSKNSQELTDLSKDGNMGPSPSSLTDRFVDAPAALGVRAHTQRLRASLQNCNTASETKNRAMKNHIENATHKCKRRDGNIPKTAMSVHLFIVKAKILKLRKVQDVLEVDRKIGGSGKQIAGE